MDYFFGFNYAQLKHPEFESFHEAFVKIGAVGHIGSQAPWIYPLMNSIPDSMTAWLQPAAKSLLKFKRVCRSISAISILFCMLILRRTSSPSSPLSSPAQP